MGLVELNLDGFPGPTHYFGGIGYGNRASKRHAGQRSRPRQAAFQAIAKMRHVMDLGVPQGILPPHPRPYGPLSNGDMIYSSSFMWAANAATVSAADDTVDGKIHFTPANLISNVHRSVEPGVVSKIVRTLFSDPTKYVVHDPVMPTFPDEGAANWTRLESGVSIAVYGRSVATAAPLPATIVPRQSLEALQWVAKRHGIYDRTLFIRQHPIAIEAGVFHNDVIATGSGSVYLMHEMAYADPAHTVGARIMEMDPTARVVIFSEAEISIDDAVASYFFNSQLLRTADGRWVYLAPTDCLTLPNFALIEARLKQAGIDSIHCVDLDQSLRNGGGPACVRLRVPIDSDWLLTSETPLTVNYATLSKLEAVVSRFYPDELTVSQLHDPMFHDQARRALHEVLDLLNLAELF